MSIRNKRYSRFPNHKCESWTENINTILHKLRVQAKVLEFLVGKLNHAAYFLPLVRYILTGLRYRF